MTDEVLLTARDIRRDFRVSAGFGRRMRTVSAVCGVSLDVKRGGVLGIVGESGCGKSTLAKIILGLDAPTGGEVLFQGRSLTEMDRKERARHIQPIFQDPYLSLNPRKRIDTIIGLPLRVAGMREGEIRQRVRDMMDLTGLPTRLAGAYPSQMSGGQRQRVAIARALISRPELVVCDEPTSALDVSIQAQILNLLQDLRRELGLTYVLISHNLAVVEHIATEVMVMNHGEVIEHRATEDLFAAPASAYTQMLLDSILTPEPDKGLPDISFTEA
ncbi:Oligopeptide transport ATP-binding protein OppF (plasmid) [Pseudooceanicola algae]|uniref:Oligopeptide transport ATP-binding protein OppF n=1 Tax=Pseudooceanicola algae TaxID=1537215 RepID=A0A418SCN0_9RHOB|nr:ATP-binding cassette domain-containing protein [Pseudooceanicola algae]QPM92269.1 Oligopeptide transport ATP-binding protein OppF [Pseudooceanicola algae]